MVKCRLLPDQKKITPPYCKVALKFITCGYQNFVSVIKNAGLENVGSDGDSVSHREITLIELQSQVVFGCAALLFMVGAIASTHDRIEGWDNFLFVYTE